MQSFTYPLILDFEQLNGLPIETQQKSGSVLSAAHLKPPFIGTALFDLLSPALQTSGLKTPT
jgi:hypothetical protein